MNVGSRAIRGCSFVAVRCGRGALPQGDFEPPVKVLVVDLGLVRMSPFQSHQSNADGPYIGVLLCFSGRQETMKQNAARASLSGSRQTGLSGIRDTQFATYPTTCRAAPSAAARTQ